MMMTDYSYSGHQALEPVSLILFTSFTTAVLLQWNDSIFAKNFYVNNLIACKDDFQ